MTLETALILKRIMLDKQEIHNALDLLDKTMETMVNTENLTWDDILMIIIKFSGDGLASNFIPEISNETCLELIDAVIEASLEIKRLRKQSNGSI